MDGSPGQWNDMQASLDPDVSAHVVEVLGIRHVLQYCGKPPKCFIRIASNRKHSRANDWNAFCRLT